MNKKLKKILLILGIIICIFIVLFRIIKVQNYFLKKIYKKEYSDYVYKYSKQYDIDPYLIFSIIKVESNFNRNIDSTSGAIGLMQLMESTARETATKVDEEVIVKESLYNPEINIKIGTHYYSYLIEHYEGNIYLAIAAYNAGMGNVDKWIKDGTIEKDGSNLENIPYKETNNYVRKVIRDYKIYKELYK